jgi:hypothetical protein
MHEVASVKEALMENQPRSHPLIVLLRQLTEVGKAFWARRAASHELAMHDPSEVARIAQDLRISVADLHILVRQDKTAADLLYRRLETLRLDPTDVDTALMRDLQRCCSKCNSKQLCAHELEDKPKDASWPNYCPNEDTISALAKDSHR